MRSKLKIWRWEVFFFFLLCAVGKWQLGLLFPSVLRWIPGNLIFASCVRGERSRDANRRRWRERAGEARCPQDWILTSLRTTYIFKTNKSLCFDLRPFCYLTPCDAEGATRGAAPSSAVYVMNEHFCITYLNSICIQMRCFFLKKKKFYLSKKKIMPLLYKWISAAA